MLQKKHDDLLQSLSEDDKTIFIDNVMITRALGAIPRGRKNLLLNNQVAANLNILLLKKKHSGDLCICGLPNSTNHYELCPRCHNVSSNSHYRHNAIRDTIVNAINQAKESIASKEPDVFEGHTLHDTNSSRADILIKPKDISTNHQFHGMYDLMIKAANSAHTSRRRSAARAKAIIAGIKDVTTIKHKEIKAALDVGVQFKKESYQLAANHGIKVTPLLISTGGTFHKTTYQFLKKHFPDADQRNWLLTDIAIILARVCAQIYTCNIELMDMDNTQF